MNTYYTNPFYEFSLGELEEAYIHFTQRRDKPSCSMVIEAFDRLININLDDLL